MITFRCWYCNKFHSVPERRIGERITCSCQYPLRIPRRSGGKCKIMSIGDRLVVAAVYAGGGALLGFGLAVVILSRVRWWVGHSFQESCFLVGGLTLLGFLAGLFGGERGVNWVGRMIRGWEDP